MRQWAMLAAMVCAATLAAPALGAAYNDRAAGDWTVPTTWEPSTDYPQSPADTATIDGFAVKLNTDLPTITSIDISGAGSLEVSTAQSNPQAVSVGSLLKIKRDVNWDITLSGAECRFNPGASGCTVSGTITTSGASSLTVGSWDTKVTVSAKIVGTGTLTTALGDSGRSYIILGADNSGYTGAWVIGNVPYGTRLNDPNALGSGTALAQVAGGSRLYVMSGASGCNRDVTLDGAELYSYYSSPVYNGVVTLAADKTSTIGNYAYHWTSRTFDVAGKVTGDGALLIATGDMHCGQYVKLSNANNDYTGGTDLSGVFLGTYKAFGNSSKKGGLIAAAQGCLGAGPVTADRGILETAADGALDNVSSVEISGGALLLVGSTETNTISLKRGGAIEVSGGATQFNYAPGTGNVQIYDGAILHNDSVIASGSVPTSTAQIQLSGGGTGGQVFMGYNSNPTGTFTVGPTANPADIYSGLGSIQKKTTAAYEGITLGGSVTITEAAAGGGFALYAYVGGGMTVNGASLNCTGQLALEGGGSFEFAGGAADLANVGGIDMNGSGVVDIPGSLSGKTLNINNGRASFAADALDATSTVNVNGPGAEFPGGGLYLDQVLTSGTGRIKVHAGGAISVGANDQASQPALDYVESGALIAVRQGGTIDVPDGHSIIMQQGGSYSTVSLDAHLSDGDVIALVRDKGSGDWRMAWNGTITADGASAAFMSKPTSNLYQARVTVGAQLNFAGKKLIIGSDGPANLPGYYGNITSYDMSGMVALTNAGNQIGTIEVRGGTLQADSHGVMGMASSIEVKEGARWYMNRHQYAVPISGLTVTGGGTVECQQYGPASIWGWKLEAGAIKPGGSVGTLDFIGGLDFYKKDIQTDPEGDPIWDYCDIEIEVTGDGGSPGDDHDQITGNIDFRDLGNAELLVQLALPGPALNPGSLGEMVVMTAPEINGQFNAAALGETIGIAGDTHWQQVAATDLLEYRDSDTDTKVDQVVLLGANVEWTAKGGDATLDDKVTYIDLGILATNYGKSGMAWDDADFTFDGGVTYLDLGILATNYGWEAGGAAGEVPEPLTLALLALGAAAVVRRRRA